MACRGYKCMNYEKSTAVKLIRIRWCPGQNSCIVSTVGAEIILGLLLFMFASGTWMPKTEQYVTTIVILKDWIRYKRVSSCIFEKHGIGPQLFLYMLFLHLPPGPHHWAYFNSRPTLCCHRKTLVKKCKIGFWFKRKCKNTSPKTVPTFVSLEMTWNGQKNDENDRVFFCICLHFVLDLTLIKIVKIKSNWWYCCYRSLWFHISCQTFLSSIYHNKRVSPHIKYEGF